MPPSELSTAASGTVPQRATHPGMGRLEAFSDGVIAIIITIMVLELKLPEHQVVNSVWANVILPTWPKLLAYLWSFVLVGLMWINHHRLLHSLSSASRPLAWLNLHLLFWMSLVPATTALIGDHPKLPGAVATYALVHGANTCGFLILRRYAQRLSRVGQARGHSVHTAMFLRNIAGVLMYLGAAACAFVWLPLAYALIAAVPLLFLSSPAMKEEAAS